MIIIITIIINIITVSHPVSVTNKFKLRLPTFVRTVLVTKPNAFG